MMRRKITVLTALILSALVFCSCGKKEETAADASTQAASDSMTDAADSSLDAADPASDSGEKASEDDDTSVLEDTDTSDSGAFAETTAEPKTIEALPSGYDLDNLDDCTISVSFTTDDFNWMGGNLKVECYATLLYDAVDVSLLNVGDSIDVDGTVTEIRTLSDSDMGRVINEGEIDEIILTPGEGGTYTVWGYDDTNAMADLGQAEVILSQDIVLHDCGEMPTDDMMDITSDKIKAYLDGVDEYKKNFSCYDTRIVIENGEVTEITRSWRP